MPRRDRSLHDESGSIDPIHLGIALLAVFVIGGLAYCIHLENPTQRFATYEEAQRAGAMAEGRWIPSFLPKSSTNIVETHDIDTNALEIRFEYAPGDLDSIRKECAAVEDSPLRFTCRHDGLVGRVRIERTTNRLKVCCSTD
jgi:hypothetical protein